MRSARRALVFLALLLPACASRGIAPTSERETGTLAAEKPETRKYPSRIKKKHPPAAIARPSRPMSLADAQKYMLRLVNRDRDAEGLPLVTWDTEAARAGQMHADDMASHGYTAHYGSDGSVPEQRHTVAGGVAMAMENAGCLADGVERKLDKQPLFSAEEIEKVESAFMNETPPHDGHRRNILTPWHNRLGIGIAKPLGLPVACIAQEFTDSYGTYAPLPKSARVGDSFEITGEIIAPAVFGGVGVARIDAPAPKAASELNGLHSYAIPETYTQYFPKGFVTPAPVQVRGSRFSIRVPLNDRGKAGLYEVSVWAHLPETPDLVMVSLRTIAVD
jgi:uncharacterized protein YkwD